MNQQARRTVCAMLMALSLCAACAGRDPTGLAAGEASPPAPSASAASTPTPRAAAPATTSLAPAALPPGDYLLGGIATDQPCTATTSDIEGLVDLGISLEELVAMNPGPRELDLPTGAFDYGSGFVDNFVFEEDWPAGCEAAKVLGRVTGRASYALSLGQGDVLNANGVRVMTHLFQTEAGAAAFMNWLPTSPTPVLAGPDRRTGLPLETTEYTVESVALPSGSGALVHVVTADSDDYIALGRNGRVVTEVQSFRIPDQGGPEEDRASSVTDLLRRAMALQEKATADTGPYDAMQQMSAPLPRAELGDYASALTWDRCCAGGRANGEYVDLAADPAMARAIVNSGRLVGFQAHYGWSPTVSTGISVFPDEPSAAEAVEKARSGKGERFDVTSVDGAVGLRSRITSEGDEEAMIDERIYFQHGSALASVLVRQPDNPNAGTVDVDAIAKAFADRLDVVLGPE